MNEQPMKSPPSIELFGLRWEYVPGARRFHRFGVSDGCRGVGFHNNPLTAYLALRRWRKEPAVPDRAAAAERGGENAGEGL